MAAGSMGRLWLRELVRRTPTATFAYPALTANKPAARIRCFSTGAGATPVTAPKAALLVIGDEILAGSITDTNTAWLAKLLHARGVDLVRVEFVPDDKDEICSSVLGLKSRVGPNGFVFTSGGIGPTHDDVTYESIASAFGARLEMHQPTVERMQVHYAARGVELNDARLRMATLPTPSEVLFTEGTWVPLVHINGVYILPGIPKLFQSMISANQERFTGVFFHSDTLYTHLGEGDLANTLSAVAAKHPKVAIGSYPNTRDADYSAYKVKLAFTSRDTQALAEAVAAVRDAFAPGAFHEPPAAAAASAGAAKA